MHAINPDLDFTFEWVDIQKWFYSKLCEVDTCGMYWKIGWMAGGDFKDLPMKGNNTHCDWARGGPLAWSVSSFSHHLHGNQLGPFRIFLLLSIDHVLSFHEISTALCIILRSSEVK